MRVKGPDPTGGCEKHGPSVSELSILAERQGWLRGHGCISYGCQAELAFPRNNRVGTAWPQGWLVFLGCSLRSAFGWSLLLLLVSVPVSCDAAGKGETAGASSYPGPQFGTRLGPCSSRWMGKQERCPNSSGILGQLVALGRTSHRVPALGPGLQAFHTDFRAGDWRRQSGQDQSC